MPFTCDLAAFAIFDFAISYSLPHSFDFRPFTLAPACDFSQPGFAGDLVVTDLKQGITAPFAFPTWYLVRLFWLVHCFLTGTFHWNFHSDSAVEGHFALPLQLHSFCRLQLQQQAPAHCGIGSDHQLTGQPVSCKLTADWSEDTWNRLGNHNLFLFLGYNSLTHCGIGSDLLSGLSVDWFCPRNIYFADKWDLIQTDWFWTPDLLIHQVWSSQSNCRVGSWPPLSGLTADSHTETADHIALQLCERLFPWSWTPFLYFWHLAQAFGYQLLQPLTHCGIGSVQLAGLPEVCNTIFCNSFNTFYCQQTDFSVCTQQAEPKHFGRSTGPTIGSQSHCRVGSCHLLTGLTEFLVAKTGVGSLTDCPIQECSHRLDSDQHSSATTGGTGLVIDPLFWAKRSSTHCRVGSCSLTGLSRTQQQTILRHLQPPTLALEENNFPLIWAWIPLLWLVLLQWTFAYIQFSQVLQFTLFCWSLTLVRIALIDTAVEAIILFLIEGLVLLLAKDALESHLHNIWHRSFFRFCGIDSLNSARLLPQRGKPGPKSRSKQPSGDNSRHWSFRAFFCVSALVIVFLAMFARGEGYVSVMGDVEASTSWQQGLIEKADAKRHDMRPASSFHAIPWHPTQTQVTKRSIRRAYVRACTHGIAWYKGKCYTPQDFPKCLSSQPMNPQHTAVPSHASALQACNRRNQDSRRLRLLNWNAGGLAAPKLDEIKIWMEHNHIDIAVISETRMTFESEWSDGRWLHVHTGQTNQRGAGIMCIISTRFCPTQNLRWRVVTPGRLMHVQVQLKHRAIDVVCCYQHTQAHNATRRSERAQWWNGLDALLNGLAIRNTLCLAGDFNTSLMQHTSHAGPAHYLWRGVQTYGAQHEDQGRFMSTLRTHGLVALNTWHSALGPTYVHHDCSSRIDYIIARKTIADGVAKQIKYAWDAPFCGTTGHAPMIGLLRKMWIPQDGETAAHTVSPAQRRQGHQAFRLGTDTWTRFTEEAGQAILHRLQQVTGPDETAISDLHRIACQKFQHFFQNK